jgi:carboxypeptidase Taq
LSTTEVLQAFKAYVAKMLHYEEALGLMYWDLRTGAPRKGVELRAEAIGTLSAEVFRLQTAPEMGQFLDALSTPSTQAELDELHRAMVREIRKDYELNRKIPAERYKAYVILASKAESIWSEAKAASDFNMFRPYLKQIVDLKREFVDYWGYEENPYDTLLDQYEPGFTVKKLDEVFGELRTETVALLQAIQKTGRRIDEAKFSRTYNPVIQRELSLKMLEQMGYDFTAGRLDETEHPFETALNLYDVRVTTKYLPNDVRSALFSTIHEGGHALYEQGVSPKLIGTTLQAGVSNGVHESQSRFWENVIGRSRPFWEYNYQSLLNALPAQFADISLDDFYLAVNDVHPSLIRIEADELTYNLHIMIRYEIEKGLINNELLVKDLPDVWRDKMQEYLGVTPQNDGEGVLQDVHWSGGDFGYFPSYALGNIYAAQFTHALEQAMPNMWDQVRQGNLLDIKAWLNEHIHQHGRVLPPNELLEKVTGEPLTSKYLISYLKDKFGSIYHL